MIVTRSIEFPMGHRLKDHGGLCRHVHGHNYKVVVAVWAKQLNVQGMVVDFSDLKSEMGALFKKYDHSLVLHEFDPLYSFARNSMDANVLGLGRIITMHEPPTAENLARLWFDQLSLMIGDGDLLKVASVTVHESSTTTAQYSKGDYT
jgi:6-pyruvoyltetrahydropterin/6-carboxytetrahydropterin synthase